MAPPATARGTVRSAREFGAAPDDERDDTDALQRGLDALQAGQTLLLEPGRYLMSKSLRLRRAGIGMAGERAVLHATNADDQALLVEADEITVASLTLTAATSGRRDAARHSRIAVVADTPGGYQVVRNAVIRDNRIVHAGDPGSPLANSASAAAILVLRGEGFLVVGNTVQRSLADGIHITGGSRHGRVLNNTVSETGDDMIAVVSYADSGDAATNTASRLLQSWDSRAEQRLVQDVLIAGNQLSGPYWGRGISVVGGRAITIARNRLDNVPRAAAVLLAREANYQTFGVDDVLVEDNLIGEVQTQEPAYSTLASGVGVSLARTGHGAIEFQSALFDDEAANVTLRGALAVRNVRLRGNTVRRASVSAVRIGVDMGQTLMATDAAQQPVSRQVRSGLIEGLSFESNRFERVSNEPIDVLLPQVEAAGVHCSGNQRDGADYRAAACKLPAPVINGASMRCGPDGSRQ